MNRFKLSMLMLLAVPALVAGCQSATTLPDEPHQAPRTCDAEAVGHLVGEKATPELLERARRLSGANTARILGPNDIVTLEYNSRRLNINTDASMTIQRINCG